MWWWTLVACGWFDGHVEIEDGATPVADEERLTSAIAHELEALAALGYVDNADVPEHDDRKGVVVNDPVRSHPGYNLYTSRKPCVAALVDAEGVEVRRWEPRRCSRMTDATLLPNGDVVLLTDEHRNSDKGPTGTKLARYTWDGELRWTLPMPAHHDVQQVGDGRLIVLASIQRDLPEVTTHHMVNDVGITLVSGEGKVLEQRSVYDMINRPDRYPLDIKHRSEDTPLDLIHANGAQWVDLPDLASTDPIYAAGNIVLTSRRQNLVVIFDFEQGKRLWAWGADDLEAPHAGRLLPNGNLLIFDNGVRRGWSRVLELNPLTLEVEWEYKAQEPASFLSRSKGCAQRLANGNTLITSSGQGRAIELTPEGEIVWEFLSPEVTPSGGRSTFNEVWRFDAASIATLSKGNPR
jgi:outer membrane protein assembly factor BamB